MKWIIAAASLLVGGCLLDSRMLSTKSLSAQRNAELSAASTLLPSPIVQPRARPPARLTVLKIRAWADASYRRRMHWREHLKEIVAGANEFLGPAVGVALEIDAQPWEREGDTEDLGAFIVDLSRKDPGADVDHVLGLTGAMPRFTAAHEMLGRAYTPGKHFVFRALNNGEEQRALKEAFPSLSARELEGLVEARVAHKEIAVFVHEWAHNLGALHEDGRAMLMGHSYNYQASQFSDENRELVALAVQARRGDDAAHKQLITLLETVRSDGWHPEERKEVLAAYGGRRVQAGLAGQGMTPVIQPAPGASPGSARSLGEAFTAADGLAAAGKLRAALDALDAARGSVVDEADWLRLAQAYVAIGGYSRALDAIAKGAAHPQAEKLRGDVTLMQRQRGLYGVPPEDEPEANLAIEKAHEALAEVGTRKVRKLLTAALARWKEASGLLALRCAVEMQEGNLRAAEQSCARAVQISDESEMAHYFGGHVALRGKKQGAAAAHFERVVALDPDAQPAYEALARIYKDTGQTGKLEALRAEHLRRFKRSI